jgi:uncharacterized membrane protein YfcA
MDLLLYILTGVVSGFLAGLLGVGGGLIIVPALVYILPHAGYGPGVLVQTAVGSSLAIIVLTAVSSIRAHHRAGSLDWQMVRALTPGICVGALAGAALAGQLRGETLRVVYLVFLLAVAAEMLLEWRPPSQGKAGRGEAGGGRAGGGEAGHGEPGRAVVTATGFVIGGLSSLVGIGGGTLSTPFMLWCGRNIHTAVATSAAIGLPIAVSGATGFVLAGLGRPDLPTDATGFVAWPAVAAVGGVSVLLAPMGARLSHRVAQRPLKRTFAALLLVLAARIAWEMFGAG